MRALVIASAVVLASFSTAQAERCTGKWDGQADTSVTFKEGRNLTYCFRGECWNEAFTGSKGSLLRFPVGTQGAAVTMTRSGNGYRAIWRYRNESSRATLTCQ